MKKKLILTLAILLGCAGLAKADVNINSKNFPDADFRTWVQNHFNKPNGATLTDEELASVKEILSWKETYFTGVSSLRGIEYFSELETLGIYNCKYKGNNCNTIENVDLSKNKKLKKIIFSASDYFTYWNPNRVSVVPSQERSGARIPTGVTSTYLKSVNLRDLPELEIVDFDYIFLTELDLRGCKSLKSIKVTHNLSSNMSLKLDTCPSLETLHFKESFHLTGLDLSKTPNLKSLQCDYCSLSSLDLTPLKNLEELFCTGNDFTSLDLSNCKKLKSLNCKNTDIRSLDCSQLDSLSSIDISGCTLLREFPALPIGIKKIVCDYVTAFAKADLSKYPNLESLSASNCALTTFDSPSKANLTYLSLLGNHIAAINLSNFNAVDKQNFEISQSLDVVAIPVQNQKGLWRVILPQSVDMSRIYSYDFYNSNLGSSYTLYSEYYEDEQGIKHPSFVTNYIPKNQDYTQYFYYQYKTGAFYEEKGENKDLLSEVAVCIKSTASGVDDVVASKTVASRCYYNMGGVRFAEKPTAAGVYVEQTVYTDGTTSAQKVLVK